jgi:hypothetical protein
MAGKKSITGALKKFENWYINFSEQPRTMWFRSILQSLDVEFSPSVGVRLSVGQFLERFIFTQADVYAQKRTKQSIKLSNQRLKKVILDHKNLGKNVEEYARLFLRFYGVTGTQACKELRKVYVNQLSNFFDVKYSKEKNKLFYQQLLFRLTIDHLHVLSFAEQYLGDDTRQRHESSETLREAIKSAFIKKGLDEALVYGLVKDLNSIGLLNATQSSAAGGDIHRLYVTDLGRKLLRQIKGPDGN